LGYFRLIFFIRFDLWAKVGGISSGLTLGIARDRPSGSDSGPQGPAIVNGMPISAIHFLKFSMAYISDQALLQCLYRVNSDIVEYVDWNAIGLGEGLLVE
jgi:hypothetical protein